MKGFKTEIEFEPKAIAGLLCCAFEGGSNYWAQIIDFTYADGIQESDFYNGGKYTLEDYWHHCQLTPIVPGCAVRIRDTEEGKEYVLDRAAIDRGLVIMLKDYPRHFADFLGGNDDAETGDVFLQCCIFGKIIYG